MAFRLPAETNPSLLILMCTYPVVLFIIMYGTCLRLQSSIIDINLSHLYGTTFDQIITRQEMYVYVTYRQVCAIIVALKNQGVLRILSVYL
jgi:hypothetical protein